MSAELNQNPTGMFLGNDELSEEQGRGEHVALMNDVPLEELLALRAEAVPANKAAVLRSLRGGRAVLAFSGGSDESECELTALAAPVETEPVRFLEGLCGGPGTERTTRGSTWGVSKLSRLAAMIALAQQALDRLCPGWEEDKGAEGTVTFDSPLGAVSLAVRWRKTGSEATFDV